MECEHRNRTSREAKKNGTSYYAGGRCAMQPWQWQFAPARTAVGSSSLDMMPLTTSSNASGGGPFLHAAPIVLRHARPATGRECTAVGATDLPAGHAFRRLRAQMPQPPTSEQLSPRPETQRGNNISYTSRCLSRMSEPYHDVLPAWH